MALKAFRVDDNKVIGDGDDKTNETVMNLFRKLTCIPNIGATREPNFLIFNAKKTFNYLRLVSITALILQYLDLEIYIKIKTNALGYAIDRVLN